MAERKLGRGLDALLGEAAATEGEEVIRLGLGQVQSSPYQPRREFEQGRLAELADSIRENGVLQPIIVRPGSVGDYEIVAGERRLRAAQMAGLEEIPAIVRRYTDDDVLILSLVENVQRADLNPIDKARAYRKLGSHLGQTHQEIARRLGLERTSVTHLVRLLDLPEEIQELVGAGALSARHGRALLTLRDEGERLRVAERIVKEDLSVRAVESLVRDGGAARPKRRSQPRKTPQVVALEAELRALLGTKVKIQDRRGKGRIVIDYFSPAEFERILERLRGSERGFGFADSNVRQAEAP